MLDFAGADSDGKVDSSASLQAANDAIEATGRPGAIRLRGGTYLACLRLGPTVSLEGAGVNVTRIKMPPGANCLAVISTSDFARLTGGKSTGGSFRNHIRDLTVDGNRKENQRGRALQIYGKGFDLQNLSIESASEEGLYTEYGGYDDFSTAAGTLEANIRNLSIQQNGATGWVDMGPHDQIVDAVVIFSNGGWGWDVRTALTASKVNTYLNRSGGIHVWTSTWGYGQVGTIYGSNITGSTATGWGALFETGGSTIAAGSFGGAIGLEVRAQHNQIHGIIANTTDAALKLDGASASGTFDLLLGGNNSGVWVDSTGLSTIPSIIRINSGETGGRLFRDGDAGVPLGVTDVAATGKTGRYVREPREYVVAVYRTGKRQQLAEANFSIVAFNERDEDSARCVTTGDDWHFTAPAGGRYRLSAQVSVERIAEPYFVSVFVNRREFQRVIAPAAPRGGGSAAIHAVMDLREGDRVDVREFAGRKGATLVPSPSVNYVRIERDHDYVSPAVLAPATEPRERGSR